DWPRRTRLEHAFGARIYVVPRGRPQSHDASFGITTQAESAHRRHVHSGPSLPMVFRRIPCLGDGQGNAGTSRSQLHVDEELARVRHAAPRLPRIGGLDQRSVEANPDHAGALGRDLRQWIDWRARAHERPQWTLRFIAGTALSHEKPAL